MQTSLSNYNQMKHIRGQRFQQQSLPLNLNLQNTVAGQSIFFKITLILLTILSYILTGFLAGFIGGITGLNIYAGTTASSEFLAMALIVVAVIATAISQNLIRSVFTFIISFCIVVIVPDLISKFGLIALSPRFLVSTTVAIAFGLGLGIINFILSRFALALTDILFNKYVNKLKIIGLTINGCFTIYGSWLVVWGESQVETSPVRQILIASNAARIVTIFSGIIFGIGLATSSWLANHLRGVPWKYPSFLRDRVLAIGSWRGTSFHNLDLSGVNFKNAKLPNTDLRARKLYRTCFQGVTGLERARVDSRYLDLEIPKVQKLLARGCSEERDFSQLNLRGAYLQGADLRHMNFTDTDLTGADLRGADLRGCIFVRAQVIDVDFTDTNLTGICIEDWSVNNQTLFTNVQCDYIYRKLDEKGEPTDRSPATRNFEPREFQSLYQEVGNVVELVFKEGINWRAFAFTLQQLQLDDENMGLELKGVEKRGDIWVVKVTHNENVPRQVVEQKLYASYEELKHRLAEKEQEIKQLLGIVSANASAIADQASAIKELSQKAFGQSFFIVGSNITNLAASGKIKYSEAAQQVRNIVSGSVDTTQVLSLSQNFLNQLQQQNVAMTPDLQAELIEQILLAEAEKDPAFKDILLNQGQQAVDAMSESAIPQSGDASGTLARTSFGRIASAIREAIAQLT
jgi:uncharacterized protein YjbI with pentapeptide repeats